MINTLEDYIYESMPGWGDFVTNPNLEQKVSREGVLLAYGVPWGHSEYHSSDNSVFPGWGR